MPVPLHGNQDLLGIGHTTEHHDRTPLAAQQRPRGHQQHRPRCPFPEPTGRILDEVDRATTQGGSNGGSLGGGEPLGRWLSARIGLPTGNGDGLLAALDGQRHARIAVHHPDLWVVMGGKGEGSSHRLNRGPGLGPLRVGPRPSWSAPAEPQLAKASTPTTTAAVILHIVCLHRTGPYRARIGYVLGRCRVRFQFPDSWRSSKPICGYRPAGSADGQGAVHPGRGMGGSRCASLPAARRRRAGPQPEAVRQRAMAAASRSAAQPAPDPGRGVYDAQSRRPPRPRTMTGCAG